MAVNEHAADTADQIEKILQRHRCHGWPGKAKDGPDSRHTVICAYCGTIARSAYPIGPYETETRHQAEILAAEGIV